jgi:signal transduction histidine kinase
MNAIRGMAKELAESRLSADQREYVQIISASAKALLSLLNNVLDFSKIEAGKTEIHVPSLSNLSSSRFSTLVPDYGRRPLVRRRPLICANGSRS